MTEHRRPVGTSSKHTESLQQVVDAVEQLIELLQLQVVWPPKPGYLKKGSKVEVIPPAEEGRCSTAVFEKGALVDEKLGNSMVIIGEFRSSIENAERAIQQARVFVNPNRMQAFQTVAHFVLLLRVKNQWIWKRPNDIPEYHWEKDDFSTDIAVPSMIEDAARACEFLRAHIGRSQVESSGASLKQTVEREGGAASDTRPNELTPKGAGVAGDALTDEPYVPAGTLRQKNGISPARLSAAKTAGKVQSKPAADGGDLSAYRQRPPPKRVEVQRPAKWIEKHTNDVLTTDQLRMAARRGSIKGAKTGTRWNYELNSVCEYWPAHRESLMAAYHAETRTNPNTGEQGRTQANK